MIQGLKDWLYLFNSGQDFQSYNRFGAHEVEPGKWSFLVWAPHAQQVNVEGDFNDWQGSPLKLQGTTGCWYGELAAEKNQLYKYRIIGPDGIAHEKIDPYGFEFERKPGSAAKLVDVPRITWHDEDWLAKRAKWRPYDEPLNIYEVHLGSFIRDTNAGPDGGYMTYQDAIDKLIPYVQELGYTHIEFLPLMEHPLDASWGYQLMGYFAPTSRFGDPQDFLRLVDAAHTAGLGVIMDWVPGHFIKNTDMLAQFDGTPTFEYTDPHRAENVRWGTWNFDLGKAQVQSFLISSAMYWLDHCHLDGLRVDAVSNMLYMDYDAGKENDRNKDGGRDNLEGIAFIKQLNTKIFAKHPDVFMMAEESSAYPQVSAPIDTGGLGFNYKWNMGWMNDTLKFFEQDPVYRHSDMNLLTFSFMYMYNEQFVLPFSHDEVVHGKKSLMHKMPGDRYNQFANLRTMYVWQATFPGKQLLFMGSEWGQFLEWRDWSELEWADLKDPMNKKMQHFTTTLNHLYKARPSLWQQDHEPDGIKITIADEPDVLSYIRYGKQKDDFTVVAMNLVPVQKDHFRVPVPSPGTYEIILNTEDAAFGGTWTKWQQTLTAEIGENHDVPAWLDVILPAMGALLIKPKQLKSLPKKPLALKGKQPTKALPKHETPLSLAGHQRQPISHQEDWGTSPARSQPRNISKVNHQQSKKLGGKAHNAPQS